MKRIKDYITEKLKINNNTLFYKYHPKTTNELKALINKLIKERGNKANLNDIDVSEIDDMSFLFHNSKFNGDISKWNVSNVKDMNWIFSHCPLQNNPPAWYEET